jgi:hypothetical protein
MSEAEQELSIEQELIQASGFETEKTYKDRQDYLICLALAVAENVSDDDFLKLSDEATTWCNEAIKARKERKLVRDFNGAVEEVVVGPVEVVPIKPKRKRKLKPSETTSITGEMDTYGIAIGTKAHIVAEMFTQGCTMKDVKDVLGSTYYNLLKRLEKSGHKVERNGHFIKLIHKDNVEEVKNGDV